jgi:lysylphosphatidylglycerol synthetase-like protein (DUF2156 family)
VLADPVAPRERHAALLRGLVDEQRDVCLWQVSRGVAETAARLGFGVNGMGIETRLDLARYRFSGPDRRNFRRAARRAAELGYAILEGPIGSLDPRDLDDVSRHWRGTRVTKRHEMEFLVRPAVLADEVDVRKFFATDRDGRVVAFAFFDPVYQAGAVTGYLCSVKRRLPQADPLVGYVLLRHAIEAFREAGIESLFLGLSPLAGIGAEEARHSWLVKETFRVLFANPWFNRHIYPLQGLAAHKASFGGVTYPVYYAFNRSPSLPRLIKVLRACRII